MFKGNVNGDGIRKNTFEVPIIAQWIRINPTRWRDRISLRVELYGCDYGKYFYLLERTSVFNINCEQKICILKKEKEDH